MDWRRFREICTIRKVATLVPLPLAMAPERVLVNVACILLGLTSLVIDQPGSLDAVWPEGVVTTWAILMIIGGASSTVGYWNYPRRGWARPLERMGYASLFLATSVYGIGVILEFGIQGLFAGLIYLGIALSKVIRLVMTSAYRQAVLEDAARHQAT
jgi:hypothetical protein